MVYETEEKLFIQLSGGPWHVLAVNGENDYERKMARAMRARNKDLKVELTFDNGYDETCLSSNTDIVAKNIMKPKGSITWTGTTNLTSKPPSGAFGFKGSYLRLVKNIKTPIAKSQC